MRPIDQKQLIDLYRNYFAFRGMKWPDTAHDAIDFAVTEVAEALDAILRREASWVRHNDRERDLGMEITQAIMMLVIAADADEIDLIETTYAWMRDKGYEPELWAGKDYVLWSYPTENSQKIHLWGLFGSKKSRLIQSACGLEFPEDHQFHKPYVGRLPGTGEPRCKTCNNYWESKQDTLMMARDDELFEKSWLYRVNRKMRSLVERSQRD